LWKKTFCDFFEASKDAAKLELVYVMYRKAMSVNAEVANKALPSLPSSVR
jgi:hypothetical protein